MWGGGPSLPSLRALPGWKFCAEEVDAVMAADTFTVSRRHRAVVKSIHNAHGTRSIALDDRLAKWPVVIAGDLSQAAIRAHFLGLVTDKERSTVKSLGRVADRADAIESMIDAETQAELLRRWLQTG